MEKVDAVKLKNIANEIGGDNGELILKAVLELESLRNKVGTQKNVIKKKQHVIDTVNHHNNRLSNDNRACKYALGSKFMEIKYLREALEEIENSSASDFDSVRQIARQALEGE